jgi:hypothetical protein
MADWRRPGKENLDNLHRQRRRAGKFPRKHPIDSGAGGRLLSAAMKMALILVGWRMGKAA